MSDCPDYSAIKTLSAALGRPAATLIALSGKRDPFYVTPQRLAAAQWFAHVWTLLDPPDGVHLRRLHYRLVSLPNAERPKKLSGDAYENTEKDWDDLNAACVDARALGFVDAADLWARIGEELEDSVPDADDFAWAGPEAPDEDEESLFDSRRGYVEQIDFYKTHTGQPTAKRGRR